MARSPERMQDSHLSVWSLDPAEPAEPPAWLQPLKAWQRWAAQRQAAKPPKPTKSTTPASQRSPLPPHLKQRAEATTQPEPGRGQALRQAHRALRNRMRAQRGLRRVLPHLYFIERSLSRQGSLALLEMPVWVLQRGLQQLVRLPADNLAERQQFSVLQQRLVDAIQARSPSLARRPARADAPDSFLGGADSQLGPRSSHQPAHSGLEVSELPLSAYDDLVQGQLPGRDDAANTGGWRR